MSDLSTHLPAEQQAIRAKCFHPSGTFVEFTKDEVEQSVPERFEKIVAKHPDRIAVKTKNHTLTYGELNTMANRVAHAVLAQQGSRAEPVGLLFEKGAPLIAAMLGVLKAGKFFVLLDPSFPEPRITALLEDSLAELVVTNRQNAALVRKAVGNRCRLIEFESIDCGLCTDGLQLRVSPDALAFISYTSGSTGRPKGLVQNHRNILHDIMLRTNAYHVCEKDRASVLASGTSQAIKNAFWVLLNGAALFPFDVQKEGAVRLARWLSQEKISICRMSSPLFRRFCEALTGDEKFPDLRVLLLASETIYKSDVELYKKYFSPQCILVTGLSSSEAGFIRDYLIDHQTDITGNEVPVGYAVEGKEVLLIDDMGREIGFNEVGEMTVRSYYVSPGYWRRPDLTQSKWIPDPNCGEKRVYLTGDLGLMLPDGCLIHKGRKDFRVKIRGYGVELAEVEKALIEHPAIREAVVAAQQHPSGEARLVAYITPGGTPPSAREMRHFLREKLPDYMIPSAFVVLDSMPLSPNGKIDRRALPLPDGGRPELEEAFVAPRTSVEKVLAGIWTEVLKLDKVGIHDNFFELGGHSLLATQVVSRIRSAFNLELPLRSLFEKPTVAGLAEAIMQSLADNAEPNRTADILARIESLSDEEAQRLLAEKDAES